MFGRSVYTRSAEVVPSRVSQDRVAPSGASGNGHPLRFDFVFDLGSQGVHSFLQDNEGFLWVGTAGDGLFRYDGYELKHYGAGPGKLSNGYIYGLLDDPLDPQIFWIGTKGGLNRFDRTTETYRYYQYDADDPQSLSHNGINTVIQDSHNPNVLWIGPDGGLNKFDKTTETFTRYQPDPDDPQSLLCPQVWVIEEDGADPNLLWIGTWGCGLYAFDKAAGTFKLYAHDPDDPQSLGAEDNLITGLAQDKDDPNVLWVGTLNGMDRLDKRTETFTHYTHNPQDPASIPAGVIALIYDDGRGTLWLGGWVTDNGLTLFDKATETFTNYKQDSNDPHSISDDQILNVYEDNAGIMWITSVSGKVDKVDPWHQAFAHYQRHADDPEGLSNNIVNVIYEDHEGVVWLGTQGGLARFDPQTETFTNYVPDPDDPYSLRANYVWDIEDVRTPAGQATDELWLSHFPGPLARFDKQTGEVRVFYEAGMESFTEIIEDPRNPRFLWVLTRPDGLVKFDKLTETFASYTPGEHLGPDADDFFLYVGLHDHQEDVIWLGGWEGGGLYRFDKQTETFDRYMTDPEDPASLFSEAIADIYQDTSGVLWVGTLGGGLEKFDKKTETFTHYTQTHGIPPNVNAILEYTDASGDTVLWLGTDSGIISFDPATETLERCYTQQDGLQGDAFLRNSALHASDGALWFGGTNGVNRFYPDQLVRNPYVPPIVLTSFAQGGDPFPSGIAPESLGKGRVLDSVTLDWRHNFFEFEYAALNYTRPEKNQYAYMLEGVDKVWYEAGTRRFGRYTGLRGGNYTLRVKGSNNDGVWNEDGLALNVTVIPPFWKRWWFYVLCGAGVLAVGGVIYRGRAQKLRAEREAAVALRESEERLRQVVQNMPVMMDAFDAENTLLVWNRECERVTGYSPEEMIGNPQALERLYPDPAYRQHVLETWAEREKDLRNLETHVTSKDGHVKTVAWSNISKQFSIPGWAEWAIGVDVTERTRAEAERERLLEQVRSQARQVQQIIDTVPEGVLLLHAGGRVQLANPAAEKALAVLAQAKVGDTLAHLGEQPLNELLTSPPTKGLWHEVKANDHVFEVIARPIVNGPEPEDWVMLLRDVTREREIQRWTQQQERLAAIGQLASGIAHDFNNIMATIVIYAQMLTRLEGLSARDKERLDTIDSQAKHASQLIQQILDFSRRSVLERRPLDILPLVKEHVKILKRTLPENIHIELAYESHAYTVDADPTRIQQALVNLAVNARDAMPDGGRLRIGLNDISIQRQKEAPLPEMAAGDWVKITVADTGSGIPSNLLPHIYDPFFTTKDPGKGYGLGLAQVHGIVRQHAGFIDVESKLGEGTTFSIYLPALPDHVARDTSLGSEPPELIRGAGETILVVEDDPATRSALLDSLELLNYQGMTAVNGREALEILAQHNHDIALVLSDVVMPEMGGIALLHTIRKRGWEINVVLLTGHPLEQKLERLEGLVAWLQKPPSLEQLADVIARGLESKP
jgi:PAS domain S-box-containing protein